MQSGFVGWNRWLEKMVGTNGKVGPNPIKIGIHRIYLRLLHTMNVRFSLLNMAQRILGVTLPNFQ